ncbi:hypothetical protein NPIL_453211 [Nephila pilipes]|uniref:Uncharacterized protein n=1 Tax=Nephila pilipes TaxID=299642 RepID=A0A8X6U8C6_NEPPI|nr:hypothetical protein NPIL_626511 [Nephila pilipes]GFT84899.1 hypothetical protein NPIL_453211 [Nephila pilipes]
MLSTFSVLWNPDDKNNGKSSGDISSSDDLSIGVSKFDLDQKKVKHNVLNSVDSNSGQLFLSMLLVKL